MTKANLDIVLLLALPASGKSEIRRYIKHLSADAAKKDFFLGPTAQLDDFPYVHLMRRIDEELVKMGVAQTIFFPTPDKPFKNPWDWGTLIHLLNEDYEHFLARRICKAESVAPHILGRLEKAAEKAGIAPRLTGLTQTQRETLAKSLEKEARDIVKAKTDNAQKASSETTVIMEFARGGPQGSSLPLKAPFGYQYALSQLSQNILEKAAILYVWVTPEQSRQKNEARADPANPGSILHHGVPHNVMVNDYGTDDINWLISQSGVAGTIAIDANSRRFQIPLARFDNPVDKTSFLRDDPEKWPPAQVKTVHNHLKEAFASLAKTSRKEAVR